MRPLKAASLYAALMLGASPAAALSPEQAETVRAFATGDMARIVIHDAPRDAVDTPFTDADGEERLLTDWPGKMVFVNFWATWCPPCLKELPSIDRMARALEGDSLEVIAISTDRGSSAKPLDWLAKAAAQPEPEKQVLTLEFFHDPRFKLARAATLLGQPTTLILDRQGREIARYQGEADWDTPEAAALLKALIAATAESG